MKKNIYFTQVLRRENMLLAAIFEFFLKVASYPRMVIEVFLRKNFGQRYFTLASALTVGVILFIIPLLQSSFNSNSYGGFGGTREPFLNRFALWYVFTFTFIGFSFKRWWEIRRNPSVFDFGKFSLYSGDKHSFFKSVNLSGWKPSLRTIEIFLEPAPFFVLGLLIFNFDKSLGWLLIISSLCYSFGYAAAYKKGDDFIMDKIDTQIANEELFNTLVDGKSGEQTRGVELYCDRPQSRTEREKLANILQEDDGVSHVS